MKNFMIATAAAALAFGAAPAMAGDRYADVFSDSNSHYLDYKTDLSEAKRELESDLRRAHDEQDRIDAYAEYEREVADAEHDFRKEMAERGIYIPKGQVTVEPALAVNIPPAYRGAGGL